MKTYEILRILPQDRIDKMLAVEYALVEIGTRPHLRRINGRQTCPLGVAFEDRIDWGNRDGIYQGSPTEGTLAKAMRESYPDLDYTTTDLHILIGAFTPDADNGRIKPEDLAEIVRLSRGD